MARLKQMDFHILDLFLDQCIQIRFRCRNKTRFLVGSDEKRSHQDGSFQSIHDTSARNVCREFPVVFEIPQASSQSVNWFPENGLVERKDLRFVNCCCFEKQAAKRGRIRAKVCVKAERRFVVQNFFQRIACGPRDVNNVTESVAHDSGFRAPSAVKRRFPNSGSFSDMCQRQCVPTVLAVSVKSGLQKTSINIGIARSTSGMARWFSHITTFPASSKAS